MARTSKAEYQIRLIETESLMVRIVTPAKVKAMLTQKFKVTETTVASWMAEVRRRWAEDVAVKNAQMPEIRQGRRDQMRAMLTDVISQANSRRQVVRGKNGQVVLNKNGEPLYEAKPDLKAALAAMDQLRDLDALDQPKSAHLLVAGAKATDSNVLSDDELAFFNETSRFATESELAAWKLHKLSS